MNVTIAYLSPTASGKWEEHELTAESFEEYDDICEAIDRNGFILVGVSEDPYYGEEE